MKYLISNDFDFIMSMDSDLSHNLRYLKNFVNKAASNSDFIVGSRYIDGGATPDWSLIRKLLSRYGNYYARVFLGSKISDYTGGFNMYSKNLLEKIDLDRINASGYGFLIELKYKSLLQAKNIFQIPIIFHDRQNGKLKIPKITIIKNFSLVPRLKFTVKK
jgi:dolichol-phosphate mannosyltransferase